jgi:hypothetical protein
MKIIKGRIKGCELQRQGPDVWIKTVWEVHEITPGSSPFSVPVIALSASADGLHIPAYQEAFELNPVDGVNLYLKSKRATGWDDTSCDVECVFQSPGETSIFNEQSISGDASLIATQSSFDATGALIVLQPPPGSAAKPQVASMPYQAVRSRFTCCQRENSSPEWKQLVFCGMRNLNVFRGYAAGTVLCKNIHFEAESGTAAHKVRYEFEVDPLFEDWAGVQFGGWKARKLWVGADGKTPITVTEGHGQVTVDMQEAISFANIFD